MFSKASKWLFDIKADNTRTELELFSVAGFILTYVQKYFPTLSGEEGAIAPIAPPPLWMRR